jgi:hypothetical protein
MIRIELTLKGKTRPSIRDYGDRTKAMDQWDKDVDNAVGGDRLRLIDCGTGRVMSEYNPVDRSAT